MNNSGLWLAGYTKSAHTKILFFQTMIFVWALFPWSIGESNPWPQQCECCALPTALIPLMGLSEINSKNYDIILGKVKSTPITPVTNSSMSEYPDNAYNIKTEIKQQQKRLSNNEVLEIISKYKAGKSTYELAKEYGCHRRTISDNLKKQGIKVTNQLMERKGVVELVIQMYSEYIKPADIAKAVGINVDSVRKILKENNVYIRKSWEYPRK